MTLAAGGAIATVVVSAAAWSNLRHAGASIELLNQSAVALHASMQADMQHDASRSELLGAQVAALIGQRDRFAAAEAALANELDHLADNVKKARDHAPDEATRRLLEAALPVAQAYRKAATDAYASMRGDPHSEAAMRAFEREFEALEKALGEAGDAIHAAAGTRAAGAREAQATARAVTIGLVTLALVALALTSCFVTRSITGPLQRLVRAARELDGGDGNLARRLPPAPAEFGLLSTHLNGFVARIGGVVAEVQRSASQISSASTQIAAGNADLSMRTESAAGSLQQTASSVEEIQAAVRQTADSAREAARLADDTSAIAGQGGAAVARVAETMTRIQGASQRIADIIGVIDGIAFQTNILALNAAVEAARAGEQGRGFAVVAGEVRALAQRAAGAAREIKSLIEHSVAEVESGSTLAQEAARTLRETVESVARVNELIQSISVAAGEQSGGIGHVTQAVTGLDRMTQQNAALVEQSAAAAEALREQAGRLAASVAGFRTQAA